MTTNTVNEDFALLFGQIAEHMEQRYGFVVHDRCDVKDPNTGEFDGLNIWVEAEQPDEQAAYVLLHLFGHSVQWNVDEELRALGLDVSLTKTEEELKRIYDYEKAASQLALTLLIEMGRGDLAQWISNWFGADWRWLEHLYRTGEKADYLAFWRNDEPTLTPLPMPEFTPTLYEARNAF